MEIDLVYLWVDNTDKEWNEKRKKYLLNTSDYNKDAIDECRFYNNDELLFSLRSVEQYAPWINKIFIITDNQVPQWLDTGNERIRVVNHKEIIPEEYLPLFNSTAIEARIPFIPELSEHFLYANDDMFFWKPVAKDFFFSDGKMICRMKKKIYNRKYRHVYGYTIYRAYKMIKDLYGYDVPYFPHHSIDAYIKSVCLECFNEFKNEYESTLNNRFREFSDIQRSLVTYYALSKNVGIFKQVKQNLYEKYILKKPEDSICYDIKSNTAQKIKNSNAYLMCLNDCRKTREKDRKTVHKILEEKFPEKSQFEK